MIKIIEDGKKEFVAVCRRCGCKYSYEVGDIIGDYVPCPFCGHIYGWTHMDCREARSKTIVKNGESDFWNLQPKTADFAVSTTVNLDPTNRCISCGEPVPEGRQICPACEKRPADTQPYSC